MCSIYLVALSPHLYHASRGHESFIVKKKPLALHEIKTSWNICFQTLALRWCISKSSHKRDLHFSLQHWGSQKKSKQNQNWRILPTKTFYDPNEKRISRCHRKIDLHLLNILPLVFPGILPLPLILTQHWSIKFRMKKLEISNPTNLINRKGRRGIIIPVQRGDFSGMSNSPVLFEPLIILLVLYMRNILRFILITLKSDKLWSRSLKA